MKSLTIRDVVGPIMVGPSSSHTAGALRIGAMVRALLESRPVRADFTLYGSFSQTYRGHGTDRALVAGMLGFPADDLRIRDSHAIAVQQGLDFSFTADTMPSLVSDFAKTIVEHMSRFRLCSVEP